MPMSSPLDCPGSNDLGSRAATYCSRPVTVDRCTQEVIAKPQFFPDEPLLTVLDVVCQ